MIIPIFYSNQLFIQKITILAFFVSFCYADVQSKECFYLSSDSINIGDNVEVFVSEKCYEIDSHLQFISPSGNTYGANLSPIRTGYHYIFKNTYDRGFLTKDWNKYSIYLVNKFGVNIDSTHFYLSEKNKNLFFTLYIDDVGVQAIPKENNIDWYHKNAGPINWGYQKDDSGGKELKTIIKSIKSPNDFLFHHFHSYHFEGNRILLAIDNWVDWISFKKKVYSVVPDKIKFDLHLRDRYKLLIMVLILCTCLYFIPSIRGIKKYTLILLSMGLIFVIMIIFSSAHKHDKKYMLVKIEDNNWCKDFLNDIDLEFKKNSLNYPAITRHGWNVPPYGLNEFYIRELGVIADASSIRNASTKIIYLPEINRNITWGVSFIPYYTFINQDYNSVWDGKNEKERGLLQLPLTFGNISNKGYELKVVKAIIDSVQNGTLISTYIHPLDTLSNLRPILDYLKNNYDMKFVTAKSYLDTFMLYQPRPIIVDIDKQESFWAYYDGKNLKEINISNSVNINKVSKNMIVVDFIAKSIIPKVCFKSQNNIYLNGEKLNDVIINNFFPDKYKIKIK